MNARDSSARLSDLLRCEHHAMAEFLVAVAEFDGRRLWVELGYPSLFRSRALTRCGHEALAEI